MAWESISVFILIPLIGILLFANGWFLKRLFDGLERKISTFCNDNKKAHDDLWKSLRHHGHTCCDEKNPKVYIEEAG